MYSVLDTRLFKFEWLHSASKPCRFAVIDGHQVVGGAGVFIANDRIPGSDDSSWRLLQWGHQSLVRVVHITRALLVLVLTSPLPFFVVDLSILRKVWIWNLLHCGCADSWRHSGTVHRQDPFCVHWFALIPHICS